MVDCDRAIALLSDYIDDVLEPVVKNEIDALLEKDAHCRQIFTQAIAQRQMLQQLTIIGASDGFDQRFRARIQALSTETAKPMRVNKRGISYIFSGAVLVAAVYFTMFTSVGSDSQVGNIQPSSTISAPAAKRVMPVNQKSITVLKEDQIPKDSVSHSIAKPINNQAIKLVGEGH